MKSMTGSIFKSNIEIDDYCFDCEIKSVNNKYLDVMVKLNKEFIVYEDDIKKLVRQIVKRGKIFVFIKMTKRGEGHYKIIPDIELARDYQTAINKICTELKLENKIDINSFLNCAFDIFEKKEITEDKLRIWEGFKKEFVKILKGFDEDRKREGDFIKKALEINTGLIKQGIIKIENLTKDSVEEHKNMLKERIDELLRDVSIDDGRVLTEAAIFADKTDITEEIVRLNAHIKAFDDIIERDEPMGRKFEFILQEMNREVNTIGSKTIKLEISKLVLDLKYEVDKIKEQIQNIE